MMPSNKMSSKMTSKVSPKMSTKMSAKKSAKMLSKASTKQGLSKQRASLKHPMDGKFASAQEKSDSGSTADNPFMAALTNVRVKSISIYMGPKKANQ